ncbi:MAG TPA: hypothetical protein VHH34_18205 [Pseudonocardiaceae bacterium]|nr:hypothetical protein [Pseudonocardiaceae bacterium]
MGVITSLEHRSIAVLPGGEATCSVVVRNTGTVVDQFTIRVLGDAQAWAQVDPTTVNLLPNEESTVVIRFQPPRSSDVAAGTVPFGIQVSSREDPAGSVVEEGTLNVGTFTDVRIELIPRQTRGRKQGRCDVAIDNLGNHPVDLAIDADDPERSLRFRPEHTDLTLQPGTTAFVGLSVQPERRFLRGPERTHPFQVRVAGTGVPPTTAEGAMVQEPLLPKWLPLALAALLAALIALVVLWQTVVKQELRSSAKAAAAEEVQGVANTANQAAVRAEEAAVKAGLPPKPVPGGAGAKPPTSAAPSPAPTSAPASPGGPGGPGAQAGREPIDFRIAPEPDGVPVNTDDPSAFTPIPFALTGGNANKTLLISDLLLQNPFGDTGILRILREVPGPPGQQPRQDVLLEVGLGNFRDLDYHFLQPWRFKPGEKVVLAISCQNPFPQPNPPPPPGVEPPGPPPCNPSASFSGQLEGSPPAAPESPVTSPPPGG